MQKAIGEQQSHEENTTENIRTVYIVSYLHFQLMFSFSVDVFKFIVKIKMLHYMFLPCFQN